MASQITDEEIKRLITGTQKEFKRNIVYLGSLFVIFGTITYFVIRNLPHFSDEEKAKLFVIPRKGEDLQNIANVITSYSGTNYYEVMAAFWWLYIFMQTFAIPGPIFLSILSGTLFGSYVGFALVWFCATSGATACYCMSWVLGKPLVVRWVPGRIVWFSKKIKEQHGNLFWYLLFLRITPLLPNWFINISSPILDIPLIYFVLATLFGLMPLNIVHLRTGLILSEVNQIGGFDFMQIVWLFALGFVALLPTLLKDKIAKLFDSDDKKNKKD